MTLSFQKLPFLVMQIIFQTMGFLDLFLLSCTSSKTKRIVKNVFKIRNHRLCFAVDDPLLLQIQSGTDRNYSENIYLDFEGSLKNVFYVNIGAVDNVPSGYSEEHDGTLSLSTYWSDPKIGFHVLHEAIFEVFGAKVEGVTINLDEVSEENEQNEIAWIENHFPTLSLYEIQGRCSFRSYFWLMQNVKPKNAVVFLMEPNEYPENHETIQLEMDEVEIEHGGWVELRDLQAIKTRILRIADVSLTDFEVNMFLRNLKALEEKSNLEKLSLEFFRESDPNVVIEGLDVINEKLMKSVDSLNQWSFKMTNGQKCTVIYAEFDNEPSDDRVFGFEILIEG